MDAIADEPVRKRRPDTRGWTLHSTISITLDIYSHVNPAMDADAANTVAALIRAR